MPSVAQSNLVIGTVAKEEVDPNTAETLSVSADGLNTYIGDGDPQPPTPIEYIFDGNTGRSAGNLAPQRRTNPNGAFRQGQFQCQARGLGSTYSAVLTPPREVFRMLKAAGYDLTYSATPTPQWTATPTPFSTIPTHLTLGVYAQGDLYMQRGVQSNFSYAAEGLGVPTWTFDWQGIFTSVANAVMPVITLLASDVLPPVASGVTVNINGASGLVLRSVSFNRNRQIAAARVAQNVAGGHAGLVASSFSPEWEIEIERPLRSALNPESLQASATSIPFSVQYGATQFNRWQHSTAQGQIINVQPGNDGGIATVRFTVRGHASTPSTNDAESLLIN